MTKNQQGLNYTAKFAEQLDLMEFKRLSESDRLQIKRLIFDHVGVCMKGAGLPWGIALQNWAHAYSGTGESLIFGTSIRTAANVAAMVNATAAHGMEMDDTHDSSVSHPGAVIIATSIATALARRSTGQELMTAIAVGYESIGRIGRAIGAADVIEYGYHPTALFGGFGAVAAAGKILGLDAKGLESGWGLMLSMAGGSMQFSEDPLGTTVKRLHGGYGAHNGILAAELASLGIAGPFKAIDGRYGLGQLFGKTPNYHELIIRESERLEIHQVSLKPYPCCRLFHSTIDALREVTNNFSLDHRHIKKITVGGPGIMVKQHMLRRPSSVMAAQYSLPFALATSIIFGPTDYRSYTEDKYTNEHILRISDAIFSVEDKKMESAFPEHFGSWVELTKANGDTVFSEVMDSMGTPARPMSDEALKEKIETLLLGVEPVTEVEDIVKYIDKIDDMENIDGFTTLCANN